MSNFKEMLTGTAKAVCSSVAAKFSWKDPNMWSKELGTYAWGDYSFAVVRANDPEINDHSQIEIGTNALFVGIYDGHHGPKAASYLNDHLFSKLVSSISGSRKTDINGELNQLITKSITRMEDDFIHEVRKNREELSTTGSCCLIGMLYKGDLIYGSLGNSAIVFGTEITGEFGADVLTFDHSVHTNEHYRQQVMEEMAQTDPNCILMQHGKFKIKGAVEVTHTIGDAYMKYHDCRIPHQIPDPINIPYLKVEPRISRRSLHNEDKFIIFASNELWEHISHDDAVKMVNESNERKGIAKKLIETAIDIAAQKLNLKTRDVYRLKEGRRAIHDDITVAVVFINHSLVGKRRKGDLHPTSIKPNQYERPSMFYDIEGVIMQ